MADGEFGRLVGGEVEWLARELEQGWFGWPRAEVTVVFDVTATLDVAVAREPCGMGGAEVFGVVRSGGLMPSRERVGERTAS